MARRSSFGLRGRGDRREADAAAAPIDRFVGRTPAVLRRGLVGAAAVAVVAFGALSATLAWRQYNNDQTRAVNDLDARVILASAVVNSAFGGDVATLNATADAPAVVSVNPAEMTAYFERFAAAHGQPFNAGIGWTDLSGRVVASSRASGRGSDIAGRTYFRRVVATKRPYVSAGIIARQLHAPVIVVAVPTFDAKHRLTGVLEGGIRLGTIAGSRRFQQLGFQGLTLVDRNGHSLLTGLTPLANVALLAQMRKDGSGELTDTSGLGGGAHRVVVYARSSVPGWTIAIDRSRSSVFAAARRSLLLELLPVALAVALVLAALGLASRRSRRELERQVGRTRAWGRLTRALAAASTRGEVADALLDSLRAVVADAIVIVAVDAGTEAEIRTGSSLPGWRELDGDLETVSAVVALSTGSQRSRSLEREEGLRPLYVAFGRRMKAVHSQPLLDGAGAPVGSISLLTERSRLDPSEWELLGVFVEQASQAFEGVRAFEHEHDLAVRLQRSLLPDRLPSVPGIGLAGEYLAGGPGVEVGGDWYDAVRRPDGIVQLCVGDVSGRGVGAATVMGRQRNVFHAYAHDFVSPAEILRRMLRHVGDEDMITAACLSIDPVAGEIAYSCAGHPPPLLLDGETGRTIRLDAAGAPPIGVATPEEIVEARVRLPEHGRLAVYTDGLVERRGENIDRNIEVLRELMAETQTVTAEQLLASVGERIGSPGDDVALVVARIEPALSFELELAAAPGSLPGVRRRLRAWLARRGLDDESAADVVLATSEALNNAIEHGFESLGGTVRLGVVDDGSVVAVEVSDGGRWIAPSEDADRGRGLLLMERLMHRVEIATDEHGTRVKLERRRGEPVGAPVPTPGI
jgi:anti-sigma regulatory factor (Ser/Thr protein kinase)